MKVSGKNKENFITYLKQVRKSWNYFYYFLILFITGTLSCVFIFKHSIPPFYVFSMYSYPILKDEDVFTFRIVVNSKEINTFSFFKEQGDIIRSNLYRFSYLKNHDFKDKFYLIFKKKFDDKILETVYSNVLEYKNLSDEKFGRWLKEYLERVSSQEIKTLEVYKTDLIFKQHFPHKNKETLLINFKNE